MAMQKLGCPALLSFLTTLSILSASSAFAPLIWKATRNGGPFPCAALREDRLGREGGSQGDESLQSASDDADADAAGRRSFLASVGGVASFLLASSLLPIIRPSVAASRSTADAVVTDRIFVEFKGLQSSSDAASAGAGPARVVIGLFGQEAPQPVSFLKQLVSPGGLPAKCKPKDTSRVLQREQLEANKVYNACKENEDSFGVNYDFSSVWRVDRDHRIDVGAVSGRFVARENPNFEDAGSGLTHDAPGVVSVRRGDDGGFGFTIYPGGSTPRDLDEDNVVVGRVLEGMDVVRRLNEMPVVQSAGVNYMGLTGGPMAKNAPSRACRYGGPMYCNELKPLKKILLERTGVL